MTVGFNVKISNEETMVENYDFDKYLYPEYVAKEKYPDIINDQKDNFNTKKETEEYLKNNYKNTITKNGIQKPTQSLKAPIDSAWPMQGHDVRHTGRSHYSTASNIGEEKWWFFNDAFSEGSPVVDNDGVIYFGSWDNHLYALYPNGTLKWRYDIKGNVETSPAIGEDGTIYVGTHFSPAYGTYFFAINPDGSWKWKYKTGDMYSSPAIGDDGTIYCSNGGSCIIALYPNNGTLKWEYKTGDSVLSSPAISDDGTVYCGSHDDHIYALYPNGTLKWKYKTGNWVHGIPTIGDDGTVYCGSDDGYMYALYPSNGSMKWRCQIGSVWGSPALDKEGNLYVGVWEKKFYAIYPNGAIKWSRDLSRRVWGQSPVVSDDGTIYFGTCDFEGHDGGPFHAVNPDGTVKYILDYTRMFWASPAIGEDGTIYICTRKDRRVGMGLRSTGYLRALGELDPNAPEEPVISGPSEGRPGEVYEFTFKTTSPLGNDVYYWIEWGDKSITDWPGPYKSGEEMKINHSFDRADVFTIRVKAKDTDDLWGPWGEFEVKITRSRDKAININSFFFSLLERFPLLTRLLPLLR